MSEGITLILEDNQGKTNEVTCERFAIIHNGKELWVQEVEGQLFIGTDIDEDDTEYTSLVLRPMATNLVSLQLEIEPAEYDMDDEEGCCDGDGDGCCCKNQD